MMTEEQDWSAGQVKEFVEALLDEQQKAIEIGERERQKAAEALSIERYRALQTAEQERGKAATALASSLERSISEGDERLREHVANQVEQINAALDSARRETVLTHESSEKAIAKAEAANERRFDAVNEFREQLAEQAANFLLREVADAQFAELTRRIAANTDVLTGLRGSYVTVETFDGRLEALNAQVSAMNDKLSKLT